MATSAFFKVNDFVEHLMSGVHNFSTTGVQDTFKLGLVNTGVSAGSSDYAALTEIAAGNGYTAGGATLTNVSIVEASGSVTLDADNVVFTATGTIPNFRYAVLYNDTPSNTVAATKPIIGYYDYGSSIGLNNTETFTVNFTTNIFTLS